MAGLYESPVYVAAEGAASCLQVDFTPIGAHLFLGVAMHELSNRVVDTVARIIRFHRAADLLQGGRGLSFVELAHECGYFDQAHLIRDFREFAGTTPREFAGRVIPGGGVLGS